MVWNNAGSSSFSPCTLARAANASDFIVNLPILRPSLRLYYCNGKFTIFMLANYLTYYALCYANFALASLWFPPLYKDFIAIDTWCQILMTSLYKGGVSVSFSCTPIWMLQDLQADVCARRESVSGRLGSGRLDLFRRFRAFEQFSRSLHSCIIDDIWIID